MFKFLKERLKKSILRFSKKIDEEGKEGVVEKSLEKVKEEEKAEKIKEKGEEIKEKDKKIKEKAEEKEKALPEENKKGFLKKIKEKVSKKGEIEEIPEEKLKEKGYEEIKVKNEIEEIEKKQALEREKIKEEPKKRSIFRAIKQKISTRKISEEQFEALFWELEVALLENNVAVEVIEKIKWDLKNELVDKPLARSKIEQEIEKTLKRSIGEVLEVESFDLLGKIKQKKPYVICFVGVNGSGKTTTIAKIAKLLQNNKLSCVLAAADTFRAAAIEQLKIHADRLGVKLIKHDYGSDPAAVAFDAIKHAKSKNIDVVLIDTAGRMHSNINLTDEMKKIIRVAKPDLKVFVGESITGNDCVEQAKKFNEAIELDAIILAKADVDEKGGAAVSVSYVTEKPVIYIGTGQDYDDLEKFNTEVVLNSLGLA